MAYLAIDKFTGMDRTRKRVAGVPGQLWTLKEGHITRGGDIERRQKFVSNYSLPAGSRYLAAVRSQLYTFGSADLAATTPVGVTYQRLRAGHATGTLTITSGQNAGNGETVTIGAKTYTFQTVLTNTNGNVLIGADRLATLVNLAAAIDLGSGSGTLYAAATTLHPTATATANGDGTLTVRANADGTGGNSLATTETLAQGAWGGATMSGGGGAALVKILDAKPFQGLLYVIAEYDDGHIQHFYDGTRVSDWDNAVTVTAEDIAQRLAGKLNRVDAVAASAYGAVVTVTAKTAGTAFTLTASDTNGGVDDTQTLTRAAVVGNVAGVAETRASADIEVTGGSSDPGTDVVESITVNSVEILSETVDWAGSNEATAIRVGTEINNGSATHGYSAVVVGAIITITAAPGTGDSPNGHVIDVTTGGTVTVTADATVTGGVDAVTAVAQVDKLTVSGTVELGDTFIATLNSTDYKVTGQSAVMGTSLYVDKQRVWSTAGNLWRYCMLSRADIWDPANVTADNDAGFLNIAEETEGTDTLVVATRYQNLAAVLSQSFISLWALDTNPANFAVSDTLDNTGTIAPHSVVRFGNNDTFYLDSTGIRSLRARDASNAPFISDVGNAIDTFVQEVLGELTEQQLLDATGAIEPRDGRLWLAVGGYIFVFSYFPGTKVSAWSYYQPDEFDDEDVEVFVRASQRLYVRCGDEVFLYGGADGTTEPDDDEVTCVVNLPFLSAGTPGTFKEFRGFDFAGDNNWEVNVAYDPNDESRTTPVGTIVRTTFNEMDISMSGNTTMVAPELTCSKGGAASISSVLIHFDKIEE